MDPRRHQGLGLPVVLAFALVAAFVLFDAYLAHRDTAQVYENGRAIAKGYERIATSARLFSLMQDAETGQRGFLLTGREAYLAPYDHAAQQLASDLERLQALGFLGAEEEKLIARMRSSIAIKMEELGETIALRREKGLDAARDVVLTGRGREAMLDIRGAAVAIGDLERREVERLTEQSQGSYRSGLLSRVLATLLGLGLIFGLYRLSDSNARERTRHAAIRDEQAERFRVTLASIGDAVIVTDDAAQVRFMNPVAERLTGWGSDWEGQPIAGVFRIQDEESGKPGRDPVGRVLSERQIVALENHTELVRRDGEAIPIDDSAAPIFASDGQLTGVVLVFRDITERRQAERLAHRQKEALEEGDRRKDEFLAMLAHELRNPLAALRNAIEVLRLVKADSEEGAQARAIIQRQVQQMARMVDDLIDVARISSGRMTLRRAPVEVREVVEAATETTASLFAERRHALDIRLPEGPLFVNGDSVRLAQVLTNLLNNAAKYTDSGGRVELEVSGTDSTAILSVRDDGPGIGPDLLPHVFDLFRQGQRSRGSEGGLGIGLNLARRIVDLHGGTIEAVSLGVGRGSTFVVTLPLSGPPEPMPQAARARGASAHRVLVVEDNDDVRRALETLLRLGGCEVAGAADGAQALAESRRFRPTVVLVDLGLPDVSGYEVARSLRGDADLAGVHLVALTGWAQEEDRRQSIAAGFDRHLVKPVEPDTVLELLASLPARVGRA
jgi:PAS domain S-box-containing protein